MTADLAAWLLARLDEDEAAAREAQSVIPDGEGWYRIAQEAIADPEFSRLHGRAYKHIARHDPARVLAEVEAKRQIIREWRQVDELDQRKTSPAWARMTRVMWFLAQPYADHPDYDPSWAPD